VTLAAAAIPALEDVSAIQAAVLEWYAANGRNLAFRRTSDAWAVLVSEVIAQQTQASRAAEAWERFVVQFPTPAALAAVSPSVVIRAWRGLGYNRRAIALRAAAIAIVEDHGGLVPDSLDALVRLPGVGPYTARAVLAIAFNRPVAALDTNIARVLGRAFLDGVSALPRRELQRLADGLVPPGRAAAWTHALMDVGAAFCRKRDPRCGACPVVARCRYAAAGRPAPKLEKGSTRSKPFPSTRRWLRGRIIDRLRDAPDGTWVSFDAPIDRHSVEAVREELVRLRAEHMLELAAGDDVRARLVAWVT
jgi:A/G-specific adenine glycosylase